MNSTRLCLDSPLDTACMVFCRLGVAGLAPRAPGTWGTALAALFAPMWFLPLSLLARVLLLAALFFVGSLAATRAETLLGQQDPPQVVVDELLGLWIALLPFTTVSPLLLLAAFLFFRLFDIWKPWPVRAAENWMRGGFGVMLDDAVAGFMAMCCLLALTAIGIF